MNGLIDIKEKLAVGQPLTPTQRDFVLRCINEACGITDARRDPNDYPRNHKPGTHWSTDRRLPISSALRDMMSGMIAGALVEARKLGAREGNAPGPKIHDPTIAHLIESNSEE